MRSKSKAVLAVLVAVIAFSAVAVGAAQAEPAYYHEGAAITKAFNVRYSSGSSRLASEQGGITISCENANATGTITTTGESTVTGLTYKNCKVFELKKNTTTKQYEEGTELTACKVEQEGGVAGELKLAELKSKLVYRAGTAEKELLVRLEPTTGTTLGKIEIKGALCVVKGSDELTGKLLSRIPRVNEEAVMGDTLSEATNTSGVLTQGFTEYELGGVKTTGVELKLVAHVAVYEGTEQIELEPIGGNRGQFGAHT